MPAHVFVLNNTNYSICIRKGIVGLPEATPGSKNEHSTNDALLSRMAIVKEGDYVLFYITKEKSDAGEGKELRGIWRAVGEPFYDESPAWVDKVYPFRCRLESTQYSFERSLRLNDIHDLMNAGKIWTFALKRASGTNAMFSISNHEFDILLHEYLKINPFTISKNVIMEPYPVRLANLFDMLHTVDGCPRYEASLMAMLLATFTSGKHRDLFGNYSDYLSYVPTSLGTEMDILLLFNDPEDSKRTVSYDIIEVKQDRFRAEALKQLIGYESWFVHKKVQGDINMVRVTAIAKRFDQEVIDYVQNRKRFEEKEIKLLTYEVMPSAGLVLNPIFT